MRVEIYGDAKQKTVSGPTVQFTADDAAPVTDLKAQITPSIAGHSSVTITANGQNTRVSLTKPVYGGAVDVTTGVVTETHGGGAYNPTEVPTDLSSKIVSATTERPASGSVASFNCTLGEYPMSALTAAINPVQDLHGYDRPWAGGGGKNTARDITYHNTTYRYAMTIRATYYLEAGKRYIFSFQTENTGIEVYRDSPDAIGIATASVYAFTCDGTRKYFYGTATATGEKTVDIIKRSTPTSDTGTGLCSDFMVEQVADNVKTPSDYEPYANICPITGFTGCNVTRTGKNLFDPTNVVQGSINGDTGVPFGVTTRIRSNNFISLKQGTYTISVNDSLNISCYIYGTDESYIRSESYRGWSASNQRTITLVGDRKVLFIFRKADNSAIVPSDLTTPMLELGSTATAYEPYQGTTLAIDWSTEAGTVYGGTIDVATGLLTVDRAMVDMGTLTWEKLTESHGVNFFSNTIKNDIKASTSISIPQNIICSNYSTVSWSDFILSTDFCIAQVIKQIRVRDSSLSSGDAAAFKTAMSGVQLVYELATPQTYQLTPQEVKTLLGTNNVWADTGNVTVSYRDGLLSNVSGIMTNSTALTTGENITYTLSQERTFQIPGTVIRTVVGNNVMSASTGNISVTWSFHWFDITPWIAYQGLTFSRNDVDAPDAGRDMSGYMHRGRVGVKEKMNVTTVQLTRAQSSKLQTLLYPETIQVRVTPYPRTNTSHTMSMYTNNVKTTYVIHRENGEDLQSLTFPLIEN